jgi:TatD DNase family protein
MHFYEAHNHLHDAWLTPHRAKIFDELAAAGVRVAVVNGSSEQDWGDVAALAKLSGTDEARGLKIVPSYGVHPWDVGNRSPRWLETLRAHLDADPRAGVGEIGLDQWMIERARPDDPRLAGARRAPLDEQIEVFLAQFALATERNLPASIHSLDAAGPLYDLLRAAQRPARGFLLHSYNGSVEQVPGFVKLGAFFSFNGSFLEPRKHRLQEVYKMIPANRLLVETDAPAMRLPEKFEEFPPFPVAESAGSLATDPANLKATYLALAELRGDKLEPLVAQVEKNFQRLFGKMI